MEGDTQPGRARVLRAIWGAKSTLSPQEIDRLAENIAIESAAGLSDTPSINVESSVAVGLTPSPLARTQKT